MASLPLKYVYHDLGQGMPVGIKGIVKVNNVKCTRCGLCAKLCPVQAIQLVDGLPKPDSEKCIACFGCAVICPEKAIEIEIDRTSYRTLQVEHFAKQRTLNALLGQERQPSSRNQTG